MAFAAVVTLLIAASLIAPFFNAEPEPPPPAPGPRLDTLPRRNFVLHPRTPYHRHVLVERTRIVRYRGQYYVEVTEFDYEIA